MALYRLPQDGRESPASRQYAAQLRMIEPEQLALAPHPLLRCRLGVDLLVVAPEGGRERQLAEIVQGGGRDDRVRVGPAGAFCNRRGHSSAGKRSTASSAAAEQASAIRVCPRLATAALATASKLGRLAAVGGGEPRAFKSSSRFSSGHAPSPLRRSATQVMAARVGACKQTFAPTPCNCAGVVFDRQRHRREGGEGERD